MNLADLLFFLAAGAVVAVLVYWELRERQTSRAATKKSGHARSVRVILRLLPPLLGLLLVAQALGYARYPMPVPSGVAATLLVLGQLCFWASILLAIWARESIGLHWAHAADFQIIPGQDLVTDGPYRYVRHPLYLSLFLVFLSAELSVTSYGVVLALPLLWFMGWQARREDLLLARHFGELYADYASRTGRFLPRFGSRV